MRSKERHEPVSTLSHDLINKLSAILGHCELHVEMMEKGTEPEKRLNRIGELPEEAVTELAKHQRQLMAEM